MTLKYRNPDRFLALHADLRPKKKKGAKTKLEEDIGPPFVSRYSHSTTVKDVNSPRSLKEASASFCVFENLVRDGKKASLDLKLQPVNGLKVYERVYSGPVFQVDKTTIELALIYWSHEKEGRPLIVEFSFRYPVQGMVSKKTSELAKTWFDQIQGLDWSLPESRSKTQYIYR